MYGKADDNRCDAGRRCYGGDGVEAARGEGGPGRSSSQGADRGAEESAGVRFGAGGSANGDGWEYEVAWYASRNSLKFLNFLGGISGVGPIL